MCPMIFPQRRAGDEESGSTHQQGHTSRANWYYLNTSAQLVVPLAPTLGGWFSDTQIER
jgi:hypothetical protein